MKKITDVSYLSDKVNRKIIIWTTLIGGFMSALVKWGSEVNMPPRTPTEISPPGAHIDIIGSWLGDSFNQHSLDYIFQGNDILGAVTLYHYTFSFVCAYIYAHASIYCKYTRLWFGVLYGLFIHVFFHYLLIPMFGLRYPEYTNGTTGWAWNLNFDEHLSEILGHIYWAVSIEICMIAVLAYFSRPIKGEWWQINTK